MKVTPEILLSELPEYKGETVLIVKDQTVDDIIKQILIAHNRYQDHYDSICNHFDADRIDTVCNNIHRFLDDEITYKEEPDKSQTTAIPAYLLTTKQGDCKHFSLFAAGILDAMKRKGKQVNWCYRFASYNPLVKTPHHVFVVVFTPENEIWIDPVPGADKNIPVWQVDHYVTTKTKDMALYEVISGVPEVEPVTLEPEFMEAVNILMFYGIVDANANFNYSMYEYLIANLPEPEAMQLSNAVWYIGNSATVGYTFGEKLIHAASVVSQFVPRQAFLTMLNLNIRGWASDLAKVIDRPDNGKIVKRWYLFGGDWDAFKRAVRGGATKKAVLAGGIGVAESTLAAIAAAAPIIAAMVPLLRDMLRTINPNLPANYEPGMQLPNFPGGGSTDIPNIPVLPARNNIMDLIRRNPLIVVGVAAGVYWYATKKKKVAGTSDDILLIGAGIGTYLLLNRKYLTNQGNPADPGNDTTGDNGSPTIGPLLDVLPKDDRNGGPGGLIDTREPGDGGVFVPDPGGDGGRYVDPGIDPGGWVPDPADDGRRGLLDDKIFEENVLFPL